jgi:glycosyltransferase involved in cell wall biosynthesis
MTHTVSVIIPTYNRREFLMEALASVQKQSYAPMEIIVVDDGSTDGTIEAVREHFPSVRVIRQPHRGVSAARNRGIAEAKGKFITFLDSDDLWQPGKLKTQMAVFRENPETLICYTDEIWIRRGVRVNPMKKHRKYGGWIYPYCLPLCIISPSSVIMRREVLNTVGVFDESLPACEDYDLWLRATARYPVHWLDKALIVKRGGHPDQLSRAFWGMDRFRVYALLKILREGDLSRTWRLLTLEELKRKCQILIQGFEKRGKAAEAALYRQVIDDASIPQHLSAFRASLAAD